MCTCDRRKEWREFCIEFQKVFLVTWEVFFGKNGVRRTLWNTDRTVNALIWVDDEKVWSFFETVYWTDINTVCVFAFDAVFGNDVSHNSVNLVYKNKGV